MNKFLELGLEDRNRLIVNTAEKMNLPEAIVEKDFWVCFVLDYLFNSFEYKEFICFKGGTSLSKVYNCIERFSEDIDLALDWAALGVLKDEAYKIRSNRQQNFYNHKADVKTEKYINEIWIPVIKRDLKKLIHDEFDLYMDKVDQQTICFRYPRAYQDTSILQILRLEIGVLAEPVPSHTKTLRSYIADVYPSLFDHKEITVRTMSVVRTFFEKITILHREAMRTNGNYPMRYSRHYYDIYRMIEIGIADESLADLELLKMVVNFKKKFYPCNWACYDEILIGNCKLIPNKEGIEKFSKDYDMMKKMIYGSYPAFDEIINALDQFENKLNLYIVQMIEKQK
ncbi:nucleotidyl transferase AbiEii/AbiGii toxin family protein [Amedibacillus sp. YH-ame6]